MWITLWIDWEGNLYFGVKTMKTTGCLLDMGMRISKENVDNLYIELGYVKKAHKM